MSSPSNQSPHLFTAYLSPGRTPWRFRWVLLGAVGLAAGFIPLLSSHSDGYPVVSGRGMGKVWQGMREEQIHRLLGDPLQAKSNALHERCLWYGAPHWKGPYSMYQLCLSKGVLVSVQEKKYITEQVTRPTRE